jgi:hypothetical protein
MIGTCIAELASYDDRFEDAKRDLRNAREALEEAKEYHDLSYQVSPHSSPIQQLH